MKKTIITLSVSILAVFASLPGFSANNDSSGASIDLETFEGYASSPFPTWQYREKKADPKLIYTVTNEREKKGYKVFLHATTQKERQMIQIGKTVNENKLLGANKTGWDVKKYPNITWEWRVLEIPTGGNENNPKRNDSAAGVYVVFQKQIIPLMGWEYQPAYYIKYVWSSTLPVGTVVKTKAGRVGRFMSVGAIGEYLYEGRIIVVASGKKNLGKWITFKRNVLDDFEKYYGTKPPYNPIIIGILTDANSTKTSAAADYDTIRATEK